MILYDQDHETKPFRLWLLSLPDLSIARMDSSRSLLLLPERLHPGLHTPDEAAASRLLAGYLALAPSLRAESFATRLTARHTPPEWLLFGTLDASKDFILHTTPPVFLSPIRPADLVVLQPIADEPPLHGEELATWIDRASAAAGRIIRRLIAETPTTP